MPTDKTPSLPTPSHSMYVAWGRTTRTTGSTALSRAPNSPGKGPDKLGLGHSLSLLPPRSPVRKSGFCSDHQSLRRSTIRLTVLLSVVSGLSSPAFAQTNVFPASGNVGIGTTAPASTLTVEKSANGQAVTGQFINPNPGTGAYNEVQLGNDVTSRNFILQSYGSNYGDPLLAGGAALYTAAGNMIFGTALANRLTITSSGNVGIGTESPGSKLEIALARSDTAGTGALTLNGLQKYSFRSTATVPANGLAIDAYNGATWTTPLVIDNTGNVGIGTTAPAAKLEVIGGARPFGLIVEGDGISANARIALRRANATGTSATGNIDWTGNDNAVGARISVNDDIAGSMAFKLGGDALGYTRMFISSSGNVGIGTTNPLSKLHVMGVGRFGLNDAGTNNIGGILVASGTGVGGARQYWIGASNPTSHNNNMFQISDYNGAIDYPLLTIFGAHAGSAAGNVGIGTTNPSHKLSVNGTVRAKEVIVDTGWADYVFKKGYRLASLTEVEAHIEREGHLPGIPSATEVAEHGVSMGEMQARLLAKVEELTLHVIRQEKENSAQSARLAALETENDKLRRQLSKASLNQ